MSRRYMTTACAETPADLPRRQSLPTSISDTFDSHDERHPSTLSCSFFGFGWRRASFRRSFGRLIWKVPVIDSSTIENSGKIERRPAYRLRRVARCDVLHAIECHRPACEQTSLESDGGKLGICCSANPGRGIASQFAMTLADDALPEL
jgi:hypothetical protein